MNRKLTILGKDFTNYSGTRFYDRRFNDIPDLTIIILCPGKSYSKLFGAESRFNNIRFNDIPGITTEI